LLLVYVLMKPFPPIDRLSYLYSRRDRKMARSPHAYVRGNTLLFYEWLEESLSARTLPKGPPIWICGDCHLGNLGPLADDDGKVAIQIRDLDQAVIGNPAHDLIRLGLSLATAARGSNLPGIVTARMIEAMIEGYERAFVDHSPDELAQPEPDIVRIVRRRAIGRKWRHLAKERLEDVEPSIPFGKRFWPLNEADYAALRNVIAHPPVSTMVLALNGRGDDITAAMVDAAYWMKGCSSLGLWRFAAIVATKGKSRSNHCLIDLKEAVEPIAPSAPNAKMPAVPAERVLAAAKALSPNLGERMAAASLLGRSMFVRELMPQDLKIEVEQFSHDEALKAARYLAFVVGKAHGRQMDAETKQGWLDILRYDRSESLDAPSWLWRAVVDLAARHEAGYLDHCRIYAQAT